MDDIKGQINQRQFLAALVTGLISGAATTLLSLQSSAPIWAGNYAPIVVCVVSSLIVGLKSLKSGEAVDEPR